MLNNKQSYIKHIDESNIALMVNSGFEATTNSSKSYQGLMQFSFVF